MHEKTVPLPFNLAKHYILPGFSLLSLFEKSNGSAFHSLPGGQGDQQYLSGQSKTLKRKSEWDIWNYYTILDHTDVSCITLSKSHVANGNSTGLELCSVALPTTGNCCRQWNDMCCLQQNLWGPGGPLLSLRTWVWWGLAVTRAGTPGAGGTSSPTLYLPSIAGKANLAFQVLSPSLSSSTPSCTSLLFREQPGFDPICVAYVFEKFCVSHLCHRSCRWMHWCQHGVVPVPS